MSHGRSIQVGQLARRSVIRTLRQPVNIVPALLFPLLLLAVTAGGLASATRLPGFPTDSYIDFFLAFSFRPGRDLRDHERRQRPGQGHPDRASSTGSR